MDYLSKIAEGINEVYTTFRDGINYLFSKPQPAYATISNKNYDPITPIDNFLQGLEGITCFSKRGKNGKKRLRPKQTKKKESSKK